MKDSPYITKSWKMDKKIELHQGEGPHTLVHYVQNF